MFFHCWPGSSDGAAVLACWWHRQVCLGDMLALTSRARRGCFYYFCTHVLFYLAADVCFAAESTPNVFIFLTYRKVCLFAQKEKNQNKTPKGFPFGCSTSPFLSAGLSTLSHEGTQMICHESHTFSPSEIPESGLRAFRWRRWSLVH